MFYEGIYVLRTDGTDLLRLTTGSVSTWDIDWSPDSQQLIYTRVSWKNGASTSIYYSDVMRVPAAGGNPINLTKDIDGQARAAY